MAIYTTNNNTGENGYSGLPNTLTFKDELFAQNTFNPEYYRWWADMDGSDCYNIIDGVLTYTYNIEYGGIGQTGQNFENLLTSFDAGYYRFEIIISNSSSLSNNNCYLGWVDRILSVIPITADGIFYKDFYFDGDYTGGFSIDITCSGSDGIFEILSVSLKKYDYNSGPSGYSGVSGYSCNPNITKAPYVEDATEINKVTQFNALLSSLISVNFLNSGS